MMIRNQFLSVVVKCDGWNVYIIFKLHTIDEDRVQTLLWNHHNRRISCMMMKLLQLVDRSYYDMLTFAFGTHLIVVMLWCCVDLIVVLFWNQICDEGEMWCADTLRCSSDYGIDCGRCSCDGVHAMLRLSCWKIRKIVKRYAFNRATIFDG